VHSRVFQVDVHSKHLAKSRSAQGDVVTRCDVCVCVYVRVCVCVPVRVCARVRVQRLALNRELFFLGRKCVCLCVCACALARVPRCITM